MTDETAKRFYEALRDTELCGFSTKIYELERGVYVVQETQGWSQLGYELAARLPGMVFPSKSGSGITWVCGSRGPHGIAIGHDVLPTVSNARATLGSLVPRESWRRPLWSLGTICKALLSFTTDTIQWYEPNAEILTKETPHGYHCCYPGDYKDTTPKWLANPRRDLFDEEGSRQNPDYKPAVTMYDVSGYYYTMLTRLRSLRVSVSHNSKRPLRQFDWTPNEAARWRDVMSSIADCKPLRNTLTGVCMGSLSPFLAFTRAKPSLPKNIDRYKPEKQEEIRKEVSRWKDGDVRQILVPGKPGPFRNAGLLVVRSGWELCAMEALQGKAIYGTIDSVALTDGFPTVWQSRGFKVRRVSQGSAHIRHRGSYHVGQKMTKPYARGEREPVLVERAELPSVIYSDHWL